MPSIYHSSRRSASLGLAAVLCLLAVLISVAGFVTQRAGERVARATALHEVAEDARFALSTEMDLRTRSSPPETRKHDRD